MTTRTEYQSHLNQEVTAAILEAEHRPTVESWRKVLELERSLSIDAATELERICAADGVVTAEQRIAELEAK